MQKHSPWAVVDFSSAEAHFQGMDVAVIYMTVSLAMLNGSCLVYGLWRIKRNEQDWRAMGIVAFCLLTVAVSAIAVKWP